MSKACIFTKAQHLKVHKAVPKARYLWHVNLNLGDDPGQLELDIQWNAKRNTQNFDTIENWLNRKI
jgi:hypothetical protein